MFELNGVEIVGYLASLLVVLALTMTSVVRLRIFSLCGAVTFLVYGSLIGSVPIIITNVSIACINIWFLSKEFASGSGVVSASAHRTSAPIRPSSLISSRSTSRTSTSSSPSSDCRRGPTY